MGLVTVFMATAISMMTALENEFNTRLQQSELAFAFAFSALIISMLLLQIPFGWLADRVGRIPLILTGLLLLGPATALLGFVTTTSELILVRIFQGIGSAACFSPLFALAGDKTRRSAAGAQLSSVTMFFALGLAFGPLFAGFLAGYWFFEAPFLLGGSLCIVGAVLLVTLVRETIGGAKKIIV